MHYARKFATALNIIGCLCISNALAYRLEHIIENLWRVSFGDEVALELRRTYVYATLKHVVEVAGKTLLVAALCVLEIAHLALVEE